MLEQLPKILNESLSQIVSFYKSMKKTDFLKIQQADIEPLVANVIRVLRYNLEFIWEHQLLANESSGSVAQTFQQHLTIFSDKLSPEALVFN